MCSLKNEVCVCVLCNDNIAYQSGSLHFTFPYFTSLPTQWLSGGLVLAAVEAENVLGICLFWIPRDAKLRDRVMKR